MVFVPRTICIYFFLRFSVSVLMICKVVSTIPRTFYVFFKWSQTATKKVSCSRLHRPQSLSRLLGCFDEPYGFSSSPYLRYKIKKRTHLRRCTRKDTTPVLFALRRVVLLRSYIRLKAECYSLCEFRSE